MYTNIIKLKNMGARQPRGVPENSPETPVQSVYASIVKNIPLIIRYPKTLKKSTTLIKQNLYS